MDNIKIKDVNLLLLIVLPLTFLIVSPLSHVLMFITIQVWAGRNDMKFRDFLYFNKTKASIVLLSILIGALLAFMNFFNHFYFRVNIDFLGKNQLSSLSALWFLLTSCVFGPIVEELFFRGFLYNFYKKKGILTAIILSSTFFSIVHYDLYRIMIIFIMGVFLALLYEITQCFWIPVIVHGSINGIHTLLVLQPIAGFLKEFLYWLHGDNVWLFRIKLLLISIVLCILAISVMFLVMRITGNNIFKGRKIKDLILINKNDDEPLIDKYMILVFIISLSIIMKVAFLS
jgi:membrane protease YdiL (CAAX protease family)